MKGRIFFFTIMIGLHMLLELYTYNGLKSLIQDKSLLRWFTLGYVLQLVVVGYAFYMLMQGMSSGAVVRSASANLAIGIVFTSFVTKLVFCSMMLLQDSGRGLLGLIAYFQGNAINDGDSLSEYVPSRRRFLTAGATMLAAIPFTSLLYGITKGKYRFTVKDIEVASADLPHSFDGLKVVQVSDIHAGSFDSVEQVQQGIDMINALDPDLVLFTGDLVNSDKNEIDPYVEAFSSIKATYGKYAVLGNHDYYGLERGTERNSEKWNTYFNDFFTKYEAMGFKLLNNESATININGESISLVGVENWGAGRYFQKYGDLNQALSAVPGNHFKILMSHDPTHWDEQVIGHAQKINLTLSGHTHGMQFGIDIPWIKWSPVQYRYKRWSGLYTENDQHLYVNRGFGFLVFPGRVGMWPEITQITLKTA